MIVWATLIKGLNFTRNEDLHEDFQSWNLSEMSRRGILKELVGVLSIVLVLIVLNYSIFVLIPIG